MSATKRLREELQGPDARQRHKTVNQLERNRAEDLAKIHDLREPQRDERKLIVWRKP